MKKQELLKYFDDDLLDKLFGFCYARTNDSYKAQELCSDIVFSLVKAALIQMEKSETCIRLSGELPEMCMLIIQTTKGNMTIHFILVMMLKMFCSDLPRTKSKRMIVRCSAWFIAAFHSSQGLIVRS